MAHDKFGVDLDAQYVVTQTIENYSKVFKDISSIKISHTQRSNRPLVFIHTDEDQGVIFQEIISTKIENKKLKFSRPNEISLSMSIARKSLERSREIRRGILKDFGNEMKKDIFDEKVIDVYDYLEEVQKTIIFSYKAIESLCNSAIPSDYIYKKQLTKKGIHEVYDKSAIERWLTTAEKVSIILPEIYKCTSPSKKNFWGHFKKLEELRNDIIHSKSSSTSKLLSELLSSDVDKYFKSCEDMLLYFYNLDKQNPMFPLMSGVSEIVFIEWEDMNSAVKKIND